MTYLTSAGTITFKRSVWMHRDVGSNRPRVLKMKEESNWAMAMLWAWSASSWLELSRVIVGAHRNPHLTGAGQQAQLCIVTTESITFCSQWSVWGREEKGNRLGEGEAETRQEWKEGLSNEFLKFALQESQKASWRADFPGTLWILWDDNKAVRISFSSL